MMDSNQVETLFDEALQVDPPERETFLKERCGDELKLVDRVLELLEKDPKCKHGTDADRLNKKPGSDYVVSVKIFFQMFSKEFFVSFTYPWQFIKIFNIFSNSCLFNPLFIF